MSVSHAAPQSHAPRASWLDSKHADKIIHFNQRIFYWVSRWIGHLFITSRHIEIEQLDLVQGSRYVIASNHQSAIDPFFLCSQVPFSTWQRMGTLHYFTANYFLAVPVLRDILLRLGGFPAKIHPVHPYGLEYATTRLKMGHSVLIFPEGRRTAARYEARRGVEVLAREPHVMIVPAHIEWRKSRWRRSFAVGIGKPIDASKLTAEEILDHIYALPVK